MVKEMRAEDKKIGNKVG
jgi:hypothetical protein